MDLQVEAIILSLKEKQTFTAIGDFLFNGDKALYTVDEIIEAFPKPNTKHSESTYRSEVVQFLQRLQQYGAGTFTIGRREQKSRFSIFPGVKEVLRSRIGKLTTQDTRESRYLWPGEKAIKPEMPVERSRTSPDTEELVGHSFVLRRGCKVEFALPVDLTEQEADRLAHFIKTLPLK